MRFILLHYHILKNAGTTVEEILFRSFRNTLSRLDTGDRNGEISNRALLELLDAGPRLRAVTSHQIHYPLPAAPGYLFFDACFLRDPLDRIRSMYDYFRHRPAEGDPVSAFANKLGLGGFVGCLVERFRWYVHNAQVNLLANGIAGEADLGEKDLETATARMLRTSFLGVVDRFDESVVAGQYFLSPVFPNMDCAQPPVNVTGGVGGTVAGRVEKLRAACGNPLFDELVRLNALDAELVNRARAEVERRFRLVPEGERLLREYRRQVYA